MAFSSDNSSHSSFPSHVPQAWADVYADKYLVQQAFPEGVANGIHFDFGRRQYIQSTNASSPGRQSLYLANQRVPRATSNPSLRDHTPSANDFLSPENILQIKRYSTPQPATCTGANTPPTDAQNVPPPSSLAVRSAIPAAALQHMRDAEGRFKNALAQYHDALKQSKVKDYQKMASLADNQSNWSDLLKRVGQYADEYEARRQKSKTVNFFRKVSEMMGKHQSAVSSWLRLLPDGAWQASVIVGGLNIIFEAAARHDEMKTSVADSLAQIPVVLAQSERLITYYPDSKTLEKYICSLYICVLETLATIVRFYRQKSLSHLGRALGKGDDYDASLREHLESLKLFERNIKDEGVLEMHGKLSDFHSTANVNEINARVRHNGLMRAQETQLAVLGQIYEICRDNEQNQTMYMLLSEVLHNQREQKEVERRKRDRQLNDNNQRKLYVLDALQHDAIALSRDLEMVIKNGLALSYDEQGRPAAILQSDHIKDWLGPDSFPTLVINGQEEEHARISALSIACALLHRSIEKARTSSAMIVLSWYCGLNTGPDSVIRMLRSLISQLISSPLFNVSLADPDLRELESIRLYTVDVSYLAQALQALLKCQLAYTPIVVLLDGISFYEGVNNRATMTWILQVIATITRTNMYAPYALKMLITSPTFVSPSTTAALKGTMAALNMNSELFRGMSTSSNTSSQYQLSAQGLRMMMM